MAEDIKHIDDNQNVIYVEFKDPITGKVHTAWWNWMDYRKEANWFAELEGRPLPYPEIVLPERPQSTGVGILEQVANKTYYRK